ncbi:lysophospholipase L1-like esterase [Saonia flava]|uniref:Lysophospholipase L1-like esterase n=1 Tax=Saonia flava TaxID=523696 RepID=A0A846QX79_9FLAO|nr:SGNH/GDSL hydrolase family protein [Saonia flava]NJB69714.1 lysophospholipase L1-like esterase [Saonia flava]
MKTIKIAMFAMIASLFSMNNTIAQDISRDWCNLGRFQEDNAALGDPKAGEDRVVFMGNSITIGWSHHQPEFFEGKPYVNRGIGGQTTPQMLLRFKQDVINLKPKVVVICAGTNDIAENTGYASTQMIMDNLTSMAEIAMANGITVVLASVHPAFDYRWRPGLNPNIRIPELNKEIKKYAQAKDIVYLDYFSAMTDGNNGMRGELTSDGVHPNKLGYEIMAPLAEAAIKEALDK